MRGATLEPKGYRLCWAGSLPEPIYREHRAGVIAAIEEARNEKALLLPGAKESSAAVDPADALADKLGSLRLNGCEEDSSASRATRTRLDPTRSPDFPTTPPRTPQCRSMSAVPRSASAPHRRPGDDASSSHRVLFVPDGSPTAEERRKPLRSYQKRLLSRLTSAWRRFHQQPASQDHSNVRSSTGVPISRSLPPQSVLLYLPTGGGKTRIAAEFMRWHLRRGRRCLFVVNRTKLVAQTEAALEELGCSGDESVGVVQAGRTMTTAQPILVASMQTLRARFALSDPTSSSTSAPEEGSAGGDAAVEGLARALGAMQLGGDTRTSGDFVEKPALPGADVVLVDEAHAAGAATYRQLCDTYRRRGAFLVGLSATPMRLDPAESLASVFDRLLVGPSISWLIRRGMLAPPLVIACDSRKVARSLDRAASRAPARSADFRAADLAAIYQDGA